MFETKLKENPKGAKGTSIMSGEFNKINKLVLRTFDGSKIPYAGSSIDISQPDIYMYEVKNHSSRNNPLVQSVSFRRPEQINSLSPRDSNKNINQTFEKSKFATIPKKINSMERILNWNPKELQRLHMINGSKRLMMEKSLGNTIPYKQRDIGTYLSSYIDLEHKPYAADYPSKIEQYHQKHMPIISPTKEFKLPTLSLSKLSY